MKEDPGPAPTLQLSAGLARSEAAPVAATADMDLSTLFGDPDDKFPPLSATLFEQWMDPQGFAVATDDVHVKSVAGDGAGGLHVVFVSGTAEEEVHFKAEDRADDRSFKATTEDGREISFWPQRPLDDQSHSLGFGSFYEVEGRNDGGFRLHVYVGARPESMPTGTASYAGGMHANGFPIAGRDRAVRRDYRSRAVSLTVDLDRATLEGSIDRLGIRGRDAEGNNLDWAELPETTSFEITDGKIVGGQFTATIAGVDTNADATLAETVKGFGGAALGEFYGPKAEEVGAVFHATSEAHGLVLVGNFGAGKEKE